MTGKRPSNDMYYSRADYAVGKRAQTHPATDAWMQGDRYGTVEKIGARLVHIKMDRSGRVRRFHPDDLIPLI